MSETTTSSSTAKGKAGSSPHPSAATLIPLHDATGHHPPVEEHGEGNWLVSYADMMTLLVGFFVIMLSFATIDPEKFDEAARSVTQEFGGSFQVPYADLAERIREILKKLGVGDQLLIKISDAGLEISFKGTVFFETGSADLKPEAKPVLENLIAAIRNEPESFNITIEGHTDDVPIMRGGVFRNNWELSSIRACRVLEAFITAGMTQKRLTAVGYGEARPLVPNRDASGMAIPENQSQNRRVIVKLIREAKAVLTGDEPAKASN